LYCAKEKIWLGISTLSPAVLRLAFMRWLLLFVFVFPLGLLGQDTSLFCQQSALTHRDCYAFYRENPTDKHGTFEHVIENAAFKTWYGKGSFIEEEKKFLLTYQQYFDTLKVNITVDSSRFYDTVVFVNKNILGCSNGIWYHYATSIDSPFIYYDDVFFWYDSANGTKKSAFLYNMTWFNNDTQHPYCLPATDRLVCVNIEYNPPSHILFLTPKETEQLKKNEKGFTVKTLFGENKKEQFVLQSPKQNALLRPCRFLVNRR